MAQPFVPSDGLAPVPAKLVARILKVEFIDMAELLRDNLEAQRRGTLLESVAIPTNAHHPKDCSSLHSGSICIPLGRLFQLTNAHHPED